MTPFFHARSLASKPAKIPRLFSFPPLLPPHLSGQEPKPGTTFVSFFFMIVPIQLLFPSYASGSMKLNLDAPVRSITVS